MLRRCLAVGGSMVLLALAPSQSARQQAVVAFERYSAGDYSAALGALSRDHGDVARLAAEFTDAADQWRLADAPGMGRRTLIAATVALESSHGWIGAPRAPR